MLLGQRVFVKKSDLAVTPFLSQYIPSAGYARLQNLQSKPDWEGFMISALDCKRDGKFDKEMIKRNMFYDFINIYFTNSAQTSAKPFSQS